MAALGKRAHVTVETEKDPDEDDLFQIGDDEEGSNEGSSGEEGSKEGSDGEEGSNEGSDGEEGAGQENASSGGSGGEEAEDEDDQNGEEMVEENPNAGWAEAMAKILGKKTPDGKPCILVKDKKVDKLSEKKRKERLEKKKQADKKKAWEMMCRVKPDIVQDKETERSLQRIATRGVVQLFNAVRKHQQNMDEKIKKVGGSERKKAKIISSVSKKDFIDILRGTAGAVVPTVKKEQPEEQKDEKPSWNVLRDDFMMGASMKDWDKASDAEQEDDRSGAGEDLNSDSD